MSEHVSPKAPLEDMIVQAFRTSRIWYFEPYELPEGGQRQHIDVWGDKLWAFAKFDEVLSSLGLNGVVDPLMCHPVNYGSSEVWIELARILDRTVRVGSWRNGVIRPRGPEYRPDGTTGDWTIQDTLRK